MNIVLDAGALIAVEREDHRVTRMLDFGRRTGIELTSVPEVVGQVWRGSPRQAKLARLLRTVELADTDTEQSKRAGVLLGQSDTSDVVDALLALRVMPGDRVLTSDPDDLRTLLNARGVQATIVRV